MMWNICVCVFLFVSSKSHDVLHGLAAVKALKRTSAMENHILQMGSNGAMAGKIIDPAYSESLAE